LSPTIRPPLVCNQPAGSSPLDADGVAATAEVAPFATRTPVPTEAATAKQAENAAFYVLRAPEDEHEDEDWSIEEDHPAGAPSAMIIAETQSSLKVMTVSMAVMELDLTESQAIVFRNAAHGGLSVVYRRPDGNIGWIDPERTKPLNGNGSTLS
jgi:hypothetical protein